MAEGGLGLALGDDPGDEYTWSNSLTQIPNPDWETTFSLCRHYDR